MDFGIFYHGIALSASSPKVKFNQLFKRLVDKLLPVEKHSKVFASVV
jgi:hypothetical protein